MQVCANISDFLNFDEKQKLIISTTKPLLRFRKTICEIKNETIFEGSENNETFYAAMLCSIYTAIHRKRQGVIFPSTISR